MQNECTPERYYNRYMDLQRLLVQAYTDWGILDAIENFKEIPKSQCYTMFWGFNAVQHICELVKNDLIITIAKLTDNDKQSNTIIKLRNCLETGGYGKKINGNMEKIINEIYEKVEDIRDTYLAHNDKNKKGLDIKIPDLLPKLEEIRECLNQLCFKDIDSRVEPFSEINAGVCRTKIIMGFQMLLHNSKHIQARESTEKISDNRR